MAIDPERLKNQMIFLVVNDPDGKYTGDMAKPEDSPELEAWAHYMARAILEELTDHAETQAGIEVEDDQQTKIGETRQSAPGVLR